MRSSQGQVRGDGFVMTRRGFGLERRGLRRGGFLLCEERPLLRGGFGALEGGCRRGDGVGGLCVGGGGLGEHCDGFEDWILVFEEGFQCC